MAFESHGQNQFRVTCNPGSIDTPTITFEFDGDTCRAELAGAKLYAELRPSVYPATGPSGPSADLRLTDAKGEVLASIIVNPRAHRDMTKNVTDIGAALLWSHWRYLQSLREP